MKKIMLALVVLLLFTVSVFSQTSVVGTGGFYNFHTTGPYGPPAPATVQSELTSGIMYVNQVTLDAPQYVGNATYNLLKAQVSGDTLYACIYADKVSAPVWQGSVVLSAVGPNSISAVQVLLPAGVYYFAYGTNGSVATTMLEGFLTGSYPGNTAIFNHLGVRWGTTLNFNGSTCPSTLGTLTAVVGNVNIATFFIEP